MLHHLVYVSDLTRGFACDFEKIATSAAEFNSTCDITGALWCDGTHFIQLLEGKRWRLERVFENKIIPARSHTNIHVLCFENWESRVFPDWSMAYLGSGSRTRLLAENFIGQKDFDPRACTASQLVSLLLYLESTRQENADIAI